MSQKKQSAFECKPERNCCNQTCKKAAENHQKVTLCNCGQRGERRQQFFIFLSPPRNEQYFFFSFYIWRVWIKLKWRLWTRTTLFTLLPSWLALAANHGRLMSLLAWTGLTHQRHATLHDGERGSKQAEAWEICAIGWKIEKQKAISDANAHTQTNTQRHKREEENGIHCSHWLQLAVVGVGGQLLGGLMEKKNTKGALIHTFCSDTENSPEVKAAFFSVEQKIPLIQNTAGSSETRRHYRHRQSKKGESLKGITIQLQPPAL